MIFLVLSGKMIFLFPENMILFFRHKRKDDLSQKNTWKHDIFSRRSGKMIFLGYSHQNTIFHVISGKMVFIFPGKIFFWGGGEKMKEDDLYQNTRGNMAFSVHLRRR